MNTKVLETLDYRPTSAPPEAKEESTLIIEPETGEEKQEVASQHLEPIKTGCAVVPKEDEECECQMCSDTKLIYGDPYGAPCPSCAVKRPNQIIFEQVDGAIKVILTLLNKLEVDNTDQRGDKQGCIWTLEGWYKHNLKWLKKACE